MWYAIILGGGSGSRMGLGRNKVLLPLAGEAVLCRSVRAMQGHVDGMVVVLRPEDRKEAQHLLAESGLLAGVCFASGGHDRQASVWNGLCALPDSCTHVLVHDGARCMVDGDTIERVKTGTLAHGACTAAVPCVDTIKEADADECAAATPDRARLRVIQTPQGFETLLLREAHSAALRDGFRGTDDASLLERTGHAVYLAQGSRRNLKLTTPEDMMMAEALLANQPSLPCLRVGQGYDVHRLTEGRDLVLCGVTVPHSMGLLGHSDADVALHALMDAMLGAMALGDIGRHFPDTDEKYRGISSMLLLGHVTALLAQHRARVTNADITIVAQKPKLLPYIPQMRSNVAQALGLPIERVNVKATTTERLGFEGEQLGISAQAVVMVQQA